MKIKGEPLKPGVPTANEHIYPSEVIEEAIKAHERRIEENREYGFLEPVDHDNPPMPSHSITKLALEDGKLVCEAEILDTPTGRELQRLIDSHKEIILIVDGFGSIEDGVVQPDYKLTSVNAVLKES